MGLSFYSLHCTEVPWARGADGWPIPVRTAQGVGVCLMFGVDEGIPVQVRLHCIPDSHVVSELSTHTCYYSRD